MRKTNSPIDSVEYGKSVIPDNRVEFLSQKCREVLKRLPGNVVEVGVYKGGTLIELAREVRNICPEYKVYAIDTFEGHPYDDGHPVHPKGKYADVSKERLQEIIDKEGLSDQVQLIQGKVENVFDSLSAKEFSFAHIDCDLYVPVKFCAVNVTPQIKKNGVIYFDDYGHEHCPGATEAVDEVFAKSQIREVSLDDGTCWSGYVNL